MSEERQGVTEEVRIPDIGDIDQVEVIEICVGVGDEVGPDDALIVIESDKASMEVPAGKAGRVASVDVAVGDQVAEGALVVTLDTGPGGEAGATGAAGSPAAAEPGAAAGAPPDDPDGTGAAMPQEPSPAATTAADTGAAGQTVEVRVPDIGEASNVVVIELAVAEGDTVAADDLLVVVESDKASMEIPAGCAGTVTGVHVAPGAEVAEGTLLATIATASAGTGVPAEVAAPASARQAPTTAGPDAGAKVAASQEAGPPGDGEPAAPGAPSAKAAAAGKRVYAGPAVRRLARELGVPLVEVKGTGHRGRIVKDDVKAYVKAAMTRSPAAGGGSGAGIPPVPAVDFSRFGPIEMEAMSRVRVSGATNLHRSWLNLPHVTQFEEADVTELEAFRATLKEEAARRGVKITPLAFIIKACCYALQAHPTFNASLDPEVRNFILKKYYHIGFAVDTPEGLVVPVIRDADRMGVWELSEAIAELAEKARTASLGLADMQGGSFSISSLGNIGGTGFTPIINAPEVAILGVSRLVTRPVWNGKDFEPRKMLPLALSYDHRAINGAEAGRFMVMLSELLGDIRRLAL